MAIETLMVSLFMNYDVLISGWSFLLSVLWLLAALQGRQIHICSQYIQDIKLIWCFQSSGL